MFDVQQALRELVKREGSDLHLKVGSGPLYRVYGDLAVDENADSLTAEDTIGALKELLSDETKLEEFAKEHEVDFSYEIPELARYRINAFQQRGVISMACRAIPHKISTIEELALPPVVTELADEERGIVLLTGTTGSGKSTTLAAMIDHMNYTTSRHIVTIEDPIEFVHKDKRSAINQREVGMDTASFTRALRRVLRQDPDVILVGEMRDEETVQTALSAAETGHLVLSTIHTVDATESINRMLDFFPPHQHGQARSMIAGTVKGVISQRLVPGADGGRVAVCEILRMTGRVRDMIMDPTQTGKLVEVIASGGYYGMQTFDQALFGHVKAGRVTFEDAMRVASSPHDFKLLMQAEGRKGTTMEDVAAAEDRRERAIAQGAVLGGPTAVDSRLARQRIRLAKAVARGPFECGVGEARRIEPAGPTRGQQRPGCHGGRDRRRPRAAGGSPEGRLSRSIAIPLPRLRPTHRRGVVVLEHQDRAPQRLRPFADRWVGLDWSTSTATTATRRSRRTSRPLVSVRPSPTSVGKVTVEMAVDEHVLYAVPPRSCARSGRCCSYGTWPRADRAFVSWNARWPGSVPARCRCACGRWRSRRSSSVTPTPRSRRAWSTR